jgi:hypothetical protein
MDVEAASQVKAKGAPSPDAEWKAPAAMVFVQLANTGMVLLSKVSIGGGMFVFALLTYRSLFGAAFILPLALLRERCAAATRNFLQFQTAQFVIILLNFTHLCVGVSGKRLTGTLLHGSSLMHSSGTFFEPSPDNFCSNICVAM